MLSFCFKKPPQSYEEAHLSPERRVNKKAFSRDDDNLSDSENSQNSDSSSDAEVVAAEINFNRSKKNLSKKSKQPKHNSSFVINKALTPDVVEFNGRRLPEKVAQYALAGNLSEEQLDEYESRLLAKEEMEEKAFLAKEQERAKNFEKLNRWQYFGINSTRIQRIFHLENEPDLSEFSESNVETDVSNSSSASSRRKNTLKTIHSGNRHLKASTAIFKRPLDIGDSELLRSVGLDTFVLLRFLRFGFDVTFFPFLFACITLIPTYFTNPYEGNETENIVTSGYFRLTLNRLEPGSDRLWVPWLYAIIVHSFILRRLWIEWETFIGPRFDFLINGAIEEQNKEGSLITGIAKKDDFDLHREQYRNSCMVEFVPESYRRSSDLKEFFEAIFPGQVKRADILLNATDLTKIIAERQHCIERYERLFAKRFSERTIYTKKSLEQQSNVSLAKYLCCGFCFGKPPNRPMDPMIRISSKCFCCEKKMVKALPYYLSKIKALNEDAESEHHRISEECNMIEQKDKTNILSSQIENVGLFLAGVRRHVTSSTGFVEFKNLTAKQSGEVEAW